ncbi:polyphenol oxidase, chloroplastic-like [Cornus florida]|uniref:polyphenol oxidase, chloroplastic-like n=1 Tax=Cornus florida TaxID=4283 RepID=UPI0028994828|nr:polyphenol oxidase, chloroplastic-like [Cornus florida]
MASLNSLPTTAYSSFTITTFPLSSCPFFSKKSQISIKKDHGNPKLSCKAINGDQNPNSTSSKNSTETSLGKLDRRNVLVGLGGLYGASSLCPHGPLAYANPPVLAPDISTCNNNNLPVYVRPRPPICCPPSTTKIIDFQLPPQSDQLRVRPAAHLANEEYISKYSEAIKRMNELDKHDPRNFMQQANVHCAYCEHAYRQVGFPELEFQVHQSSLFFPFHRWYLYFYEKILGKLIDDPTFALPFWNYDAPPGMQLPAMYADSKSPLYDKLRDKKHQPPTIIDLYYDGKTDKPTSDEKKVSNNLIIMYRQMVYADTARLFLGGGYPAGHAPEKRSGSVELVPHNIVHDWTGDRMQPKGEDMGVFYSAGRDPIFFAHHSNVDRLWTIWKTLDGRRKDYSDPDWLNTEFFFYNENKQLVRVKVQDCLDAKKLGYDYQPVDIPWKNARPTPKAENATKKKNKASGLQMRSAPNTAQTSSVRATSASDVFPTTLNRVVRVSVPRPKKSRSKKEKEEEKEVLVIEGIELERDEFVKFDVYINDEDETPSGPNKSEFAGSFVNVPMGMGSMKTKASLSLGINELLEDVGAEDDDNLLVTLVPRAGTDLVTIGGIKIEFDSS